MPTKTPLPPGKLTRPAHPRRGALLWGTSLGLALFTLLLVLNLITPANPLDTWAWQTALAARDSTLTGPVLALTHAFDKGPVAVYTVVLSLLGALIYRARGLPAWVPPLGLGATMLLSAGLVTALKRLITRPRPPADHWLTPEHTYSFPSGHSTSGATLAVALFLTLYPLLRRAARAWVGGVLGLLALAVAATRVYAGVHWLTDTLAGLALGTALACAAHLLLGYLPQRTHPTRKAAPPR